MKKGEERIRQSKVCERNNHGIYYL